MLQQEKPDDFVIATGETHTVREFVELAFGYVGLNWKKYVVEDTNLFRPAEIYELRGDADKAQKTLGWKPTVSFKSLVAMMVDEDLRVNKKP